MRGKSLRTCQSIASSHCDQNDMDAQIKVRQEAQEKQDVLADLLRWQPETSKRSNSSSNNSVRPTGPAVPGKQAGLAPLRGQRGSANGKQAPTGVAPHVLRESANSAPQAEAGTAAKHTYDYFKDKWDKFDYDAVLADDDNENSTQKQAAAQKQAAEMQHQMKNLRYVHDVLGSRKLVLVPVPVSALNPTPKQQSDHSRSSWHLQESKRTYSPEAKAAATFTSRSKRC